MPTDQLQPREDVPPIGHQAPASVQLEERWSKELVKWLFDRLYRWYDLRMFNRQMKRERNTK